MKFRTGQKVKVEKLKQVSELHTLDEGYWIEGELVKDIQDNSPVEIYRVNRNGVKIFGMFNTSVIKSIDKISNEEIILHTQNSQYKVTLIEDFS